MRLIINADDAGIDVSRNRGIFEAIDGGLVKSVSVIVAQGGWDDVVARLQGRKDIGAGLHVNLTAGRPLIDTHESLVKEDGYFYNKFDLFKKAMAGLINADEVQREFQAQLKMFLDAGLTPSHIDAHNHVHLLPGAREAFMKVFAKGAWVRLPFERPYEPLNPKGYAVSKIYDDIAHLTAVTNFLCVESKRLWKNRFRFVKDFQGMSLAAQPTLMKFKKAISDLKGDTSELMCHPGSEPDKDSVAFSRLKERQMELKILLSDDLKNHITRSKIKIISYRDLKSS